MLPRLSACHSLGCLLLIANSSQCAECGYLASAKWLTPFAGFAILLWSTKEDRMTSSEALAMIHKVLDGNEWSSDTLDEIADIVRAAGYTINDCNEEQDQ